MKTLQSFPEVFTQTTVVVAYDAFVPTTNGDTTGWWLVVSMPVNGIMCEGEVQLLPLKPTNKQIRQAVKECRRYELANNTYITEAMFDVACDEFGIYWSESGMSTEYDADYESEQHKFVCDWFNCSDFTII